MVPETLPRFVPENLRLPGAERSVSALPRALGVSRQGGYAHVARGPSERAREDARLGERVRAVHEASKQRYGSPRVLAELKRERFDARKRRVERAMRSVGLSARPARRGTQVVVPPPPSRHVENLV